MPETFKEGDKVWVNESTTGGRKLRHEWYGEIDGVLSGGNCYEVRDSNPDSAYFNEVFVRLPSQLERRE